MFLLLALLFSYQLKYMEQGIVQVTLELPTLPPGAHALVIPRAIPMGYGEQPYDRFVQGVQAFSPSGETLPVARQDGPRWLLGVSGKQLGRVSYTVDVAAMEREILSASDSSKARPGYLGILGYSVFGYIEGYEDAPVKLQISGPKDWPVFSTLGSETAPNFYALADSQIIMGPKVQVRRVAGTVPLQVAIYAEKEIDVEKLTKLAAEAFERVIAWFGSAPFSHYTVHVELLRPVSERHRYGFSMEHLESSTFYLTNPDGFSLYNFAHHMAHAWIPKRAYGEGYFPFTWELAPVLDSIWFSEGFAQYAAIEALAAAMPSEEARAYRERILDTRFRKTLAESPDFLRRMSLVELSRVASTRYAEDFRTGRLTFSRGGLMAAEMDDYIRAQTKGRKSLRDALRGLMAWSARNHRGFRIAELPEIFREATGVDVRKVFNLPTEVH